jgi:pentatricopeptide repeat protein
VADLYAQMIEDGVKPDVYTYTTMIRVFSGNLFQVFDLMKKDRISPNKVTYTTMIDAFAKGGKFEKAIEVFDSMKKDGIEPNEVTFGTILDCYAKSGKHLHEMLKMVIEMRESSIDLDIRAWNNII